MLHSSDDRIHLQLVCAVVAFGSAERSAEKSDRVFETSVCEHLLEYCADRNLTSICLENEVVLDVR
jgi:hypothetical protein